MENCKSLAHCRQHGVDLEPEGTYLDTKVLLVKHRCKACGRVWAEVYTNSGILVDLNDKEVSVLEVRGITGTDSLDRLEFVLKNLNDLTMSDKDRREDEDV